MITYTNRRNDVYYLHIGKTKKGNPKYFFSKKAEGNIAKYFPEGYEIYENPNTQVFLRKIPEKIISDQELALVKKGMRELTDVKHYLIDIKNYYRE